MATLLLRTLRAGGWLVAAGLLAACAAADPADDGPTLEAEAADSALSSWDFGGTWGYVGGSLVFNPATGAASCPVGYTDTQALGTTYVDYPVHFCIRPHQDGVDPVLDFGGMYGYVNGTLVGNPSTNATSCAPGYWDQTYLDTSNVDYPLHVCYRQHLPGAPTYFGGMWGYVNGALTQNPATGAASCPAGYTRSQVFGTTGVDYPLYLCWFRPTSWDYGGAYGYVYGAPVPNPATGAASCPAGYTDAAALGTSGVDYPVHYCIRPHQEGVDPVYDFGGMWGYVAGALVNNPITGAASCPAAYQEQKLLELYGVDSPLHVCYKPHAAGTISAYGFGGVWGFVDGAPAKNPAVGAAACPEGYTDTQMLGTANLDYALHVCWSAHVPRSAAEKYACVTSPAGALCEPDVQRVGSVPYGNCIYGFHTGLNWYSSTTAFYDAVDRCAFLHDNQCWAVNHFSGVNEGLGGCSQTVNFIACIEQVTPQNQEEADAKDCVENSLLRVGADICEPNHAFRGRGYEYPLYPGDETWNPNPVCSQGHYFFQ
ncbi:MAG: hypothetical protein QM820_06220 [Minicystis sp.]